MDRPLCLQLPEHLACEDSVWIRGQDRQADRSLPFSSVRVLLHLRPLPYHFFSRFLPRQLQAVQQLSVTVCHVFLCGTSLNWCHGLNVGLLYGSHSLFCKEWTIRYLADPRILYGQCGYPSSPLPPGPPHVSCRSSAHFALLTRGVPMFDMMRILACSYVVRV